MLQQTQVATVKPYFRRFIERFPDVQSLAVADQDQVLSLWSGLGYYARGRNLHRAAQQIANQWRGEWPHEVADWMALPGVGPSTAGAIVSLSFDVPAVMLDGNAKRLLARYFGFALERGRAASERQLWSLAEQALPKDNGRAYTQGLMDIGATLCKPKTPRCEDCPLAASCVALRDDLVTEIPRAKQRQPKRHKTLHYLLALDRDGKVFLTRRPPSGIWGGLLCLPEFASETELWAASNGAPAHRTQLQHAFTHFTLTLEIWQADQAPSSQVQDAATRSISIEMALGEGLPAPIRGLLETL